MVPISSVTKDEDFSVLSSGKLDIPISDSLNLRVYPDTSPANLKIADLQKGLILVYKGEETIGEGTGFGVPVLMYSNETYFSGSAEVFFHSKDDLTVIRKNFFMDRIKRNRIRNATLENRRARVLIDRMSDLYQKHRHLRFLSLKGLINDAGVRSGFVKTAAKGNVVVTYTIVKGRIRVNIDLKSIVRAGLERVFILNEQGSEFFRVYSDSTSMRLVDREIGAWEVMEAEWASMTSLQGVVGFRLKRLDGCILRVGRELLKNSLNWVGLDYEISPKSATFDYEIEILEG